jgi:hypothetical protein
MENKSSGLQQARDDPKAGSKTIAPKAGVYAQWGASAHWGIYAHWGAPAAIGF